MDAVEVFMEAVTAIDQVVAKCEVKGQAVQGVVDAWDLNMFGQNKRSTRSTISDGDMPLGMLSMLYIASRAG